MKDDVYIVAMRRNQALQFTLPNDNTRMDLTSINVAVGLEVGKSYQDMLRNTHSHPDRWEKSLMDQEQKIKHLNLFIDNHEDINKIVITKLTEGVE